MTDWDRVANTMGPYPSMWDTLKEQPKVDGSMRRAAQLRKDITAWRKTGEVLRRRMEESRLESKMEGILFDVELSASERAFFASYEPVAPGDPPLPEIHADNS